MRRLALLSFFFLILLLFLGAFHRFGKIVVIRIYGPIYEAEKEELIAELNRAERDPRVKGIVLEINSPGGSAEAIEEIYLKLLKLREKKPLVSYISAYGASGAYYLAAPSHFISAKPSSQVGAIGVIVSLPKEIEEGNLRASGPYKLVGSEESAYRTLEILKNQFLSVIEKWRGRKLKIEAVNYRAQISILGSKPFPSA